MHIRGSKLIGKALSAHKEALDRAERARNRARGKLDRAAKMRTVKGAKGEAAYAKAFARWVASGRRISELHRIQFAAG
jgi:hypothetical protein